MHSPFRKPTSLAMAVTSVIAVGEMFDGMSRVKKQQAVYAPLMEYIADNRIHALSIKAFTPQEWARDRKLNGFELRAERPQHG